MADVRHPSDEALVAWLESGRPARVSRHLDGCEPCLERLDGLSVLDEPVIGGLEAAGAPPVDLVDTTAVRVRDRLVAEEAVALTVELFALPWQVVAALADRTPISSRVVDAAGPANNTDDDDGERHDG